MTMLATRFTALLGCSIPIQQAAMGGIATPELVAAVSDSGALGMLGTSRAGVTPESLLKLLTEVGTRTSRPFGVNFLATPANLSQLDPECIEIAARTARVVELFYGRPSPDLVAMIHAGGALASWQVGSREEAVAAQEAGCDLIVAQGIEAGGYVRGTIGILSLLGEVLPAVDIPVLAAGGIGSGRLMAAALAAGADGVRVGTRFIAAAESGAHPEYVRALVEASPEDAIYAQVFSSPLVNGPHRVLRASLAAAEAFRGEVVGEIGSLDGTRVSVPRLGVVVVDRTATGTIGAMPLWAGESVGAVRDVQLAGDIVRDLVEEAEQLLRKSAPL
jgi:NAD(P)H-dependent flavin oxidoreductase YrpB (nitropropane dioxygenase family)